MPLQSLTSISGMGVGFTPAVSPLMRLVSRFGLKETTAKSGGRVLPAMTNPDGSGSGSDTNSGTGSSLSKALAEVYNQCLLDFTVIEEKAIKSIIESLPQLQEFKWSFIKIDDSIELGRPWVFQNHIILPSKCCAMMSNEFAAVKAKESDNDTALDDDNPYTQSTALLFRMQVYMQAADSSKKYEKFCQENLGFLKVKQVVKPPGLKEVYYTDPNCLDDNWVFARNDAYVFLCLVVNADLALEARAYDAVVRDGIATVSESWLPATDVCAELGVADCHHPLVILGGSPFVLFEPAE